MSKEDFDITNVEWQKDIKDISVYYLDKSFGDEYLFVCDNIVYKSNDSVVYSLKRYVELHNEGLLDGWIFIKENSRKDNSNK